MIWYYIGVVAFDTWLNSNPNDVEIVTATPIDNSNGAAMPPTRIESIQAYDHPNDDGTAMMSSGQYPMQETLANMWFGRRQTCR